METKSSKEKKISLAEKINNLIIAAPTNFGSDDEDEETKARVVDKYEEASSDEDVGLSLLRKQNVSLLEDGDERYKGKKISRKDIFENDPFQKNDSDNNEEIESNYNSMEEDSIEDSEDNDSDDNEATDEDNDEENDQSDSQGDYSDDSIDSQQVDGDDDKNFKNIIPSNEGEIEKGQCVHNQLKIWDNLLEMRIKLQKCLVTSNKLPQYTTHNDFMTDEECLKRKNETKNSLMKLLDKMLNIQDKLLNNYPETKGLLSTKQSSTEKEQDDDDDDDDPMNEEIDSDTEEEKSEDEMKNDSDEPPKKKQKVKSLSEYEKILDENHKKYSSYRNSMIQKWNDKTRIASGKINKGVNQSVVKQIEFLLNDKFKLIQKTQLKRSEYEIIGKESTNEADTDGRRVQEYDPEIYDDDDFYQQLLTGLIEQKVADISDPIQLSKQWVQLQNMRSKMKRKIDTKATKGRRIRYNVHPKLINFMAPITVNDTWSDEMKTELYNSLFGKIKGTENN
ncbi:protein AATF-like [Chelonus insularis]|uniref:protein AATF-like n=1 Tax=Chelonus insularis TaxID=460826 RepID=UPI0015883601|nr:protein AATF-like [Chelonus insularis]